MRYLPQSPEEIRAMLDVLGLSRAEDLFASVPEEVRLKAPLDLPAAVPECDLVERFIGRSSRNRSLTCRPSFLGAGAYAHFVPSVVNHVLLRSEFYTAYTPYQPELAQGTLQAIFEFQTMMADLCGMEVCNASLYDGASAAAEAALLAARVKKGRKVLVARSLHPAYREVVRTYLGRLDLDVEELPFGSDGRLDLAALKERVASGAAAVLVGQPNFFGVVEDVGAVAGALPEGAERPLLAAVVTEALSLALLEPPGRQGADVVCGEARSFGLPLGYGGPNLGFLAARKAHVRQMPGRLVGETKDHLGRRGFVLTLTTREQHIRREKATSNICTNQGLCMLAAVVYLALMGRKNLRELALRNLSKAEYLKARLKGKGITPLFSSPTFNEFAVTLKGTPEQASEALRKAQMVGGLDLSSPYPEFPRGYLLCATEQTPREAMDRAAEILGGLP